MEQELINKMAEAIENVFKKQWPHTKVSKTIKVVIAQKALAAIQEDCIVVKKSDYTK